LGKLTGDHRLEDKLEETHSAHTVLKPFIKGEKDLKSRKDFLGEHMLRSARWRRVREDLHRVKEERVLLSSPSISWLGRGRVVEGKYIPGRGKRIKKGNKSERVHQEKLEGKGKVAY